MSNGLLDCLLNTQSKTAIPAGQKMQVVMIDREHLHRNPYNDKIYIIGDVSRLKEDIKANGIRQPLEVVRLHDDDYQLIGGERRMTACDELSKEGAEGFDVLPCIIRESKDPDDDKIALITANATARDLTDGERLAQYEALKEVLSRKKRFGQLQGKVRDELCRILGLSTGAAARLNAIAENCDENIKRQLRNGEITLMGAYRYAQAVIADKTADIKMPETVRENPKLFEPKEQPLETLPTTAPEYPEWVLESAKEVCSMDFVKSASEFTGEALAKGKGDMCGRSLKKGFVDFYRDKIRFWGMGKGEYVFTCAKFVRFCIEKGIAPQKAKSEPHKNVSTTCENSAPEPRGRATLLALAEKTLNEKGGWIFDRDLWKFKLTFYQKELPGGAMVWRLDDTQRDAVGLAPGEHTRYAIIYKSGDFFTTGWENYTDAVESLIRYLNLK